MKRRLDVALGLVHRPRVVYLDEPTTGLDPEARVSMWEELGRIAGQEALTILLTTHYLEEADHLANRLAIVSRGHIVVEGTPNELKRSLEGDSVIVELSDGNVTEARAVIESLDGIREVRAEGRHLRSRVDHGARAIPQILSALDRSGHRRRGRGLPPAVARRRLSPLHRPRLPRGGRGGRRMNTHVARDTWYMVGRQARNLMREPIWIALLVIQPLVWLTLYGQLFKSVTKLPGGGFGTTSYITFLAPAIVVMNAFFGGTWSGMAMITDLDREVIPALPRDAGEPLLAGRVAGRPRGDHRDDPGLIILLIALPSACASTPAFRAGSSSWPPPPCCGSVRRALHGDRPADAERSDHDRGRQLHRPAAPLPFLHAIASTRFRTGSR